MSDKPVTLADGTPVPKQSNTDYDVVVDEKCYRVRLISCAYCHAVAPEVADHTAAKEWAIRHVRDECQLSPTADLRSRLARAETRIAELERERDIAQKSLVRLMTEIEEVAPRNPDDEDGEWPSTQKAWEAITSSVAEAEVRIAELEAENELLASEISLKEWNWSRKEIGVVNGFNAANKVMDRRSGRLGCTQRFLGK